MKERGTDQNLPHVKLAEGGLCHRIEGVAAVPNRIGLSPNLLWCRGTGKDVAG